MLQLAFDIGGTFTDLAVRDVAAGTVDVWKILTTPDDPARAVLESLAERIGADAITSTAVTSVLHATTVATNAILERKGSRTALITTRGFRDVLIIGRQKRYDTNNLHIDKPVPLIERADIFEVPERLAPDGTVVAPLDVDAARAVALRIRDGGYRAVAIALLHAYANPEHEQCMAALLRDMVPDLAVTLSSVISPKFREYERTNTAVADAYIKPLVAGYVSSLQRALSGLGITATLAIMQSNGGLMSAELACDSPIRIVESGPAAGVLMAARIGAEEGFTHVMSFDMGGTTTKLGAVDDGIPAVTPTFEVDAVNYRQGSGLPLNIMAIELLEIGAGGGSIARMRMGLINVGPDSAGAEPGPICYGRGGTAPTITDANLVLGYLNPGFFNGGTMALDVAAASEGIASAVATPLGLPLHQAAWGIHSIANANMERAMRVVSIERGRDPRHYTLVAFGGAGPLHAARLARALGIPRVIVPRGAGVGSALGLLVAAAKIDIGLTRIVRLDGSAQGIIADIFGQLEARVTADARRMRPDGDIVLSRSASMHHVGQGYEIRVDLPAGSIGPAFESAARAAFYARYKQEYGYIDTESALEVTDWYVVASVASADSDAAMVLRGETRGTRAIIGTRLAWFPEAEGLTDCVVIDRYALRPGETVAGPALVEERESTTVVLPGDTLRLSERGNLIIEIGSASA